MKKCKICGQDFLPKRNGHLYCSPACTRTAQDIRQRRNPNKTSRIRKMAEWRSLDAFREEMGMRPIKRGIIPCQCCGGPFYSEDHLKNRLCFICSNENAGCLPAAISVGHRVSA
jgi:hypothetical protein